MGIIVYCNVTWAQFYKFEVFMPRLLLICSAYSFLDYEKLPAVYVNQLPVQQELAVNAQVELVRLPGGLLRTSVTNLHSLSFPKIHYPLLSPPHSKQTKLLTTLPLWHALLHHLQSVFPLITCYPCWDITPLDNLSSDLSSFCLITCINPSVLKDIHTWSLKILLFFLPSPLDVITSTSTVSAPSSWPHTF